MEFLCLFSAFARPFILRLRSLKRQLAIRFRFFARYATVLMVVGDLLFFNACCMYLLIATLLLLYRSSTMLKTLPAATSSMLLLLLSLLLQTTSKTNGLPVITKLYNTFCINLQEGAVFITPSPCACVSVCALLRAALCSLL